MNEDWLKSEELMAAAKWTAKTLQRKVRSGELKWRTSKSRGANGRPAREYLLSSLRSDLQLEVIRRRTAIIRHDQAAANNNTAQLIPFRREPASVGAPRIVLPDPEAQAEAEHRLQVIGPLLDYLQWKTPTEKQLWCARNELRISNSEDLAAQIASKEGCASSTIWRWVKNYRTCGFAALADRIRADKGQSRWFSRHHDAAVLAAYLYLGDIDRKDLRPMEKPHRGQSIAFVYDQICERAEQLGIGEGELPSRETVRNFLSQISPAMRTLAREGQRQYHERMAPYIRRRYDDIYANQIWIGDQMWHDAEVMNDGIFDDVPLGTPLRLRLDAFEDYRSRKIVGATWTHFGSSRSISATLLRAILQYGPPEMIYVDNGKDYKKVAKGAQRGFPVVDLRPDDLAPIEQTGFLARAGIGVTHCIPRHPQSKGVERCFGTVHHFDAFFSTYTSGETATRPEATGELMMQHRRLLKAGRAAESKHPLASRFILACLAWIEKYNKTPHSGEGMDGRSPNEVFETDLNPAQKPTPEPATLAMLMAEYERRKVRECAVTLNNRRYTPRPDDRLAWATMHEANELEILIAFDPCDAQHAAALTLDGRFIAWLEAETLLRFAPHDPETQRQIGQSMEIRRGLEKATKTTLRSIARAARANGALSAEEMALNHLQLPASTAPVISQRKASLRPDKTAVAPPSAADIASSILASLREKVG